MDHCQKISVHPIRWDDATEEHLDGLGNLSAGEYRKMYEANEVNVFAVFEGSERVASFLLRWERNPAREQVCVIVAAAGRAHANLIKTVWPVIKRCADRVGAVNFRFHTRRVGLLRTMAFVAGEGEATLSWRVD